MAHFCDKAKQTLMMTPIHTPVPNFPATSAAPRTHRKDCSRTQAPTSSRAESPLRRLRRSRRLTLQTVADAVASDTGNLSRIEKGQQLPTKQLARRLVEYFDREITVCEILCPEEFDLTSAVTPASAPTQANQ